ncbi:hypothetical protein LLEC1_01015 [Akanthomyces lecanii]|uniref:Uncharacterized protein n=1 Tax=Cordyceps confragosa TaxID=2714763 RepID=A0A179IFB3_CORDF|nr:hypothetical protein LLEC1_01015 [Akanthomyces lecanii]
MYVYPMLRSRAAVAATQTTRTDEATTESTRETIVDKQSDISPSLRGFVFEGIQAPVQKPARMPIAKPACMPIAKPTLPVQELERLAVSSSPFENISLRLKTDMFQQLATTSDSVFVLSADGKTYQEPIAVRGVPEKGWLSLDKLLLAEKVAQEKKHYYRAQAPAFGIPKTDRNHKFRRQEKVASDDCSKYAKIREIFGQGHGKYHPNQLVAKKYMPAQGLCEKELLYKFALKISNLQQLYQKKKLAMDPYDFYRWVICKKLKSDLQNALSNSRNSLSALIRSLGDDGGQSDPVFRAIVLYWASLTGKDNRFGGHKKPSRLRTQPSKLSMPDRETSHAEVSPGGRDLARRLSRLELRKKRRRKTNQPPVYSGVNAHRAEKVAAKL